MSLLIDERFHEQRDSAVSPAGSDSCTPKCLDNQQKTLVGKPLFPNVPSQFWAIIHFAHIAPRAEALKTRPALAQGGMGTTRPLRFSEASLTPDREIQQPKYLSPACIAAAEVFTANIQRTDLLSVVPGYSFMKGEHWSESMAQSKAERGNGEEPDADTFSRAENIYFNIFKTRSIEDVKAELHRAKSNVEISLSRILMFQEALTALLEAMLIRAWTAYESMAHDLHRGALNHHATRFTQAVISKNEYGFASERLIVESYSAAFQDPVITLAAWNSEVKALAVLRNLLIHKRGIVDKPFMRQCAGQDRNGLVSAGSPVVTDFLAYHEGTVIPIEGKLVRGLIDRLATAGYELIATVDDWLK